MNGNITEQQFKDQKIGVGERLSYGASNFGGNLIYATISSFATAYYTDSVGIAAATVGTMMLIARLFDALSDVAVGGIIDRTHRKNGQAKPWYVWSILPLAISLILVFGARPEWSNTTKIIYMYVTYIWSAVFCYTANYLANVSMQALMTGSQKERMKLNAAYQIFGFICIILVNVATGNLAAQIGWLNLSVIYALVATVMLSFAAFFCKERKHLILEEKTQKKEIEKIGLEEGVVLLLKNKYAMIILLLSILNYITVGSFNAGGVYYATYIYGQPALFGLMTLAGMLPTILLSSAVPALGAKFGKKNVLVAGYLLQGIGYLIVQLLGHILPFMIIGLVIKGIALSSAACLLIPMIGDVIEDEALKTGKRLDGLMNAVSSCGIKVGTGFGAALVGWVLGMGGYIANADIQPDSAVLAIKLLVGGIPAICGFIGFFIGMGFDLEKKGRDAR